MIPSPFSLLRHRAGASAGASAGAAARVAALALSLALLACSSDSSVTAPKDDVGRFSAVVSGASQTTLTGLAGITALPVLDTDSLAVPASVVLILQDQATAAQLGFEWFGTATLVPDTYPVGSADEDVGMGYVDATGTGFNGVGGTITVTSVTNGVVTGSFSGNATPSDTTGPAVSISGNFKARIVTQ